ncbi:MAG: VTT domain-containing protein [Planctomycetota bacterium]|nr:VTT domain-containing protein [Planctomycetota bacterium]
MRLFLKVLAVTVVLAVLLLAGFALWGGAFERLFSQEASVRWFQESRPWAWAAAILLLVGDLLLPVPASGIMAALGNVYGVFLGTLIGAAGAVLSGMLGYAIARLGGKRLAGLLADEQELDRFRAFFDRWGGFAVIVSRLMPILPEVTSLLAGLARMRLSRFVLALVLGCVPAAALFAYLGNASREQPWWGLALAVGIPLVIWPVFLRALGRKAKA